MNKCLKTFQYLTNDCQTMATKSRRHSNAKRRFRSTKIKRLSAHSFSTRETISTYANQKSCSPDECG